jgi:aminopeptidase N
MEYPALVMISDNIGEHISYEEVIVHEVAHQWWYSLVGNDQINYGFLDEGLTEYSTILFFENNPEYG